MATAPDGPVQPGPWFDAGKFERACSGPRDMQLMAANLTRVGCVVVPGKRGEKRPNSNWASITRTPPASDFRTDQMGVLTGPSNLCVVDVDVKDSGLQAWNLLVELLDLTALIKDRVPYEMTTTGGFHFYFKNPSSGPLPSRAKLSLYDEAQRTRSAGIDVRGEGGYVRCSPSAHIGTGGVIPCITWVNPPGRHFPELPQALERVLRGEDVLCEGDDGSYTLRKASPTKKRRAPIEGTERALEDPDVRRLVMERLSEKRAEVRDDWLRVLFALAYEDFKDGQEDRYLELCKDFSKRTRRGNVSTDEEVAKLYGKAYAGAAHAQRCQPTTLGTLKMWATEDNPLLQQVVNTFDDSDYYWQDFCRAATAQVWGSFDAFVDFCDEQLPRVLAIISKTPVTLISKHSEQERYNIFEHLPDMYSFRFSWKLKDQTEVGTMKFSRFLAEHHLRFHCFKHFDVDPAGTLNTRDVFNVWPGLTARLLPAYDESKIQPFQEVVRLWANGDENAYRYVLAWLRFLVARPDQKANVALVVTGQEGSGKSVLCEFLRDFVLGPAITAFFDGVEDMTEKHNCRKAGRRLWVLEECRSTKGEFIHAMDALKRLVTNPMVVENPKGLAIREVRNIGMMVILSNHEDCINVTLTDRRYTFLQTSAERCGAEHRQWWADIRTRLMTQETGNHVYTWLMSLQGLPDPTVPYQNDMRRRVQETSKPGHLLFLEERLRELAGVQWWISKRQLYQEYRQWCVENGYSRPLSVSHFHGKVAELASGPMYPLDEDDATKKLSITPHRKGNARGYAPRHVPRGVELVAQPPRGAPEQQYYSD